MRLLRSLRLLGAAMSLEGKVHVHAVVSDPPAEVHLTTIPLESTDVARELAAALLREADRIESREAASGATDRGEPWAIR